MTRLLEIVDWGLLEYRTAFERQKALVRERIAGESPDRLVLTEHPPVVTIGRSGSETDLRYSARILEQKGVDLCRVDRGGQATYHGPGQMVVYPVIKLIEKDLHLYLARLLEAGAMLLRGHGLEPELKPGRPGLWVNGAKIASVGMAVKSWVTYHGLAMNLNTDLAPFDLIVPCGRPEEKIASLQNALGRQVDPGEVKKRFVEIFQDLFNYDRILPAEERSSRHPDWLVRSAPSTAPIREMEKRLTRHNLATVCQSAHCPNLGECFGRGTATFMILGSVCTRGCRFCAVDKGRPAALDPGEPLRAALAARELGLKYVVVTSVTRDDLEDGGAGQFARTIKEIRRLCPETKVEVLIPDLLGSVKNLEVVVSARPDMLNHNVETVSRLYPAVRPRAKYKRSLGVLEHSWRRGLSVKSGLMLGLGETRGEIERTLMDLYRSGCRYLTLGQYLAPSPDHYPQARYVSPDEFDFWGDRAREIGFFGAASGPLVRSSYRAEEMGLNLDRATQSRPSSAGCSAGGRAITGL